jgi:signal transduction histidine kinase
MLLEALANTTAVAIENVNVYRNLENQVKQRTQALEAANAELEAFTSAVSHDLRAPLRTIHAELALRADANGAIDATSVRKVRDCADRMTHLIDDLLRLSKITRTQLERRTLNLGEIAHSILARLKAAEPEREVSIEIDVPESAEADEGLITAALDNLLSNAWKYSAKRQKSHIVFRCTTDAHGHPVYTVKDNGAGFNPELTDRLFQPFSRLHDANDFAGTGVGLATVQRIIQHHGGRIWAESDGVSGAQFSFTLEQ